MVAKTVQNGGYLHNPSDIESQENIHAFKQYGFHSSDISPWRPWYILTISPIHFRYGDDKNKFWLQNCISPAMLIRTWIPCSAGKQRSNFVRFLELRERFGNNSLKLPLKNIRNKFEDFLGKCLVFPPVDRLCSVVFWYLHILIWPSSSLSPEMTARFTR